MYVKPAPNRQVRMPYPPYAFMGEAGANVPPNTYWAKRFADGSIVFADDPNAPSPDADETPEPTRKVKGKGSKE